MKWLQKASLLHLTPHPRDSTPPLPGLGAWHVRRTYVTTGSAQRGSSQTVSVTVVVAEKGSPCRSSALLCVSPVSLQVRHLWFMLTSSAGIAGRLRFRILALRHLVTCSKCEARLLQRVQFAGSHAHDGSTMAFLCMRARKHVGVSFFRGAPCKKKNGGFPVGCPSKPPKKCVPSKKGQTHIRGTERRHGDGISRLPTLVAAAATAAWDATRPPLSLIPLHHFETNGTIMCWYLQGSQGFMCRILFASMAKATRQTW